MSALAHRRKLSSIKVGETASLRHSITAGDIRAFARLSGDRNPLHADAAYAKTTAFKRPVVHGMFLGALVSRLIGMKLPGAYSLMMRESLDFKKPVFIGDTIIVLAKVVHASPATGIVELAVDIRKNEGDLAGSGAVLVRVLK
jgi:acyl dehydratase